MASKDVEIALDVDQEQDGGFVADCLDEDIITQGDSYEELRKNVREAVSAFFFYLRREPVTFNLRFSSP